MNRRDFLKRSLVYGGTTGLAIMGTGAAASLISACTASDKYDAVIANGWIYAGDGKEPLLGSIGIKGGKIAAIGKAVVAKVPKPTAAPEAAVPAPVIAEAKVRPDFAAPINLLAI